MSITINFVEKHRINILRAMFVLFLPLLLIVHPAIPENGVISKATELLGLAFIIAGVLGRFWSILYIGGRKSKEVMMLGPYSICRHPLYLFSTTASLGFGLLMGSFILASLITMTTFIILMLTAKREEEFLIKEFGTQYRDYIKSTPMILPNVSKFQTPRNVDFDVNALKVNLFDSLVFLALIPIAEVIDFVRDLNVFGGLFWV